MCPKRDLEDSPPKAEYNVHIIHIQPYATMESPSCTEEEDSEGGFFLIRKFKFSPTSSYQCTQTHDPHSTRNKKKTAEEARKATGLGSTLHAPLALYIQYSIPVPVHRHMIPIALGTRRRLQRKLGNQLVQGPHCMRHQRYTLEYSIPVHQGL